MRLVLLHPDVALRSCTDCQQWMYLDKPGEFGERLLRGGKPVPRGGGRPICWACPKQPPDVPERDRRPHTAVELTAENWQAYRHYRECRAVGVFPDDDLVRRDAAVIRQVEDRAADYRQMMTAVAARQHAGA